MSKGDVGLEDSMVSDCSSEEEKVLVIELGASYELRCGAVVELLGYASCFVYGGVLYQKMFSRVLSGEEKLPESSRERVENEEDLLVVASPRGSDPLDIVRRCKK